MRKLYFATMGAVVALVVFLVVTLVPLMPVSNVPVICLVVPPNPQCIQNGMGSITFYYFHFGAVRVPQNYYIRW